MRLIKIIPVLLFAALFQPKISFSQKKVGFNGQQIEMAELGSQEKSAAISAKSFSGKKLLIVEGDAGSFGKGLALGNNRFLISVPAETGGKELLNAGIKSWAPVTAKSKLSPELNALITRPETGVFDVYVVCIPGIEEKQITGNWSAGWGQVKEVWKGENYIRLTVSATAEQVRAISNEGWSMQLEEAEGEIIPHNQNGSENGRINAISSAGFGWSTGLSGKGVTVGVGDGGLVDYHADLETHQFNLITSKLTSFADHPDHVSGTIAGSGLINPAMKGMAPEARVLNHQTSNIISNAVSLRNKQNMTLTNNSYGSTFNCTSSGQYNSTSSLIDGQTSSNLDLLHVVSAGNAGSATACSSYPAGFYNLSQGNPIAKNCLTVGQVNASDAVNSNSCKGPARDGRLKPEIMANGELNSTIPSDRYGFKSGTSQSAPVVTGALALLTERYRQLNSNQNPEAALLKALVCNTADDLDLPNADFSSGYGRLNARKARRVLEASQFSSGSIASNSAQSLNVTVPAGCTSVKIMLAWTDPAAASNPVKALINDLNLSVLRSNGAATLPWVLNPSPSAVNQAAVRGIDSLNNMEQATLTVTPGEVLTIRTTSRTISGNAQKYWLVYDWIRPELVLTAPQQNQMLRTATSTVFRWDMAGYTFSSLVLESSTDSVSWATAQTVANPASMNSSFTPSGTTFRRMWYRFRGVSGGQNVFSNAIKVFLSPQPAPTATVCDRTVRLSWTAISGATRYQVLWLNRSSGWESRGFTTAVQYFVSGLENGKREFFAVRPWFGNEAGLQSTGISVTPAAGNCAWTKDLGVSRLVSPASGRLFTSSAPSSTIQLELQNYSSTAVSAQACVLNFRKPDGSVQQFPLTLSLGAGVKQNYTLPATFNNNLAGNQRLRFWLSTAGDVNPGNDTLSADVKILANNPERSFPLNLNFESVPAFSLNAASLGIPGEDRLDFISSNQARAMSSVKNAPSSYGSKSLVLDKERLDTRTGTSEAVFTLNLSSFPAPKELKITFDCMLFSGSTLPAGNGFSFRPSDQSAWITVKNFSQESFVAGVPKKFADIDLLALLAGTSPGSSFQLRFTFSGTRSSEIETQGGYAIDNIIITLPSADVKASAITLPPDDCYPESQSRPVKLQVVNNSPTPVQKLLLSYQVNGAAPVTDTLQNLGGNETYTHTFSRNLGTSQFGNLDVRAWVSSPGDGNASNDSLPIQKAIHYKLINQFPLYESFEDNAGSWAAYTEGSQGRWTWGQGLGKLSAADSAANGSKFWFTNPASALNGGNLSYLQSPCLNVSRLADFQVSFHLAYQLNGDQEQGWLEVSQDGINWTKAGSVGAGMNWYNAAGDQWAQGQTVWQPVSLKFPAGSFSGTGKLRFRFAMNQTQGSGGHGFALDDFHIEAASEIENEGGLDQSLSGSTAGGWLSFGREGKLAAVVQNDVSMGSLNLQMQINQDGIRSFGDRYYLNRNYLLMPQFAPAEPQIVRFFVTESDVAQLMTKDLSVKGFQQLGVFRYHGPNRDFSPDNNDFSPGNDFAFSSGAAVKKVPTFGGHYLEVQVPGFSEFYIASRSLVDYNAAAAFRVVSMDLPPHQPVEIKWLTPTDETAGKELDKKIAWLDPASGMLYLDGINGNSARIRLIDLKGQTILDESFTGFRFETRTSSLSKGVYTLRVEQESGAETFRLLLD